MSCWIKSEVKKKIKIIVVHITNLKNGKENYIFIQGSE